MVERFYGFAYCSYNILRLPAALIRLALGRASFPRGKLLYRAFGALIYWYGVNVCAKTFPFGEGGPP